jgi:hypothetical protein
LAIFGYTVLLVGVYKLLKIETELAAIKKLLVDRAPASLTAAPQDSADPIIGVTPTPEPHGYDDATEYAAKLLRAVNAQSDPPMTPNYPVRPESR